MLVEKMRGKIHQYIEEIPDELLERAYCMDVIQKKLQLQFSGKIYHMFPFNKTYEGFLKAELFNGFQIIMEGAPLIPDYDYETLEEENNGNMS